MAEKCHYCHERITDYEDETEVVDSDGSSRIFHTHCETDEDDLT